MPFARFVARNNIHHLKRYNIERVYRQKRLYGLHPRELTECAFDIITNTPTSGLSEAELLQIVNEILVEHPYLQVWNIVVCLNLWWTKIKINRGYIQNVWRELQTCYM